MKNLTLLSGAARSGKSSYAEKLAEESGLPVYYLATMQICADDNEQQRRLKQHKERRPPSWRTIECPYDAHETIACLAKEPAALVFDCLSLYLSNILLSGSSLKDAASGGKSDGTIAASGLNTDPYEKEAEIEKQMASLLFAMEKRSDLEFFLVSSEVSWGLVPENKLGRAFCDFLGLANQRFAREAEKVYLLCAGLSIKLK